ncbi:MAG: DNA polymerase III subunit delta [Erysipelotrichaceae bacterium]|nr:DNA polymerase III subunit delta [Erysipelotrichaceae bacterium]MDY5251825.1 DNA polymerase III subunit delta [Erysipelotrichaceae bacterium]
MFKDYLAANQPIAYRILSNALANKQLAHAYIFYGRNNTTLLETALFLAQSIVCKQTIACEQCNVCQRVKNFNYGDLLYLDGKQATIKKEDILNLQQQFAKTALEQSGSKIYIINHVENASDSALNSLLKFLEEPASNNIYAIFITDNIYQVLPTIVSRCEIIQFRPDNMQKIYQDLQQQNIANLDSYFLSGLNADASYVENETYQLAVVALEHFVKAFPNKLDDFLLFYQLEMFGKDKDQDLKVANDFLELASLFLRDLSIGKNEVDGWYGAKIQSFKQDISLAKCLLIILQQKDKCNKTNNLRLIIDEMIYKLQEVINERTSM